MTPLSQFLTPAARPVPVEPEVEYSFVGVRSFGMGCFNAGTRSGSETRYPSLLKLKEGDFIYPRLMAWEGAFAFVPEHFDGWVVSPEFSVFRLDRDRVDSRYLEYLFKVKPTWARVAGSSTGTNVRRKRLYPGAFLSSAIALPLVTVQRDVADRLDRTLAPIRQSVTAATASLELIEALRSSALRDVFAPLLTDGPAIALSDAVDLNPETVNPTEMGPTFIYVDIGSIENGTGRITLPQQLPTHEAPSRARRLVRRGDVVVSTVRPNLKGSAIIPDTLDGAVASTGLAVLRPKAGLDSRFLLLQVLSDAFVEQLTGESRGGHYPAINDSRLKNVRIAVPTPQIQSDITARLESVIALIAQAADLRHRAADRLAALEPSVVNSALNVGR